MKDRKKKRRSAPEAGLLPAGQETFQVGIGGVPQAVEAGAEMAGLPLR